MVSKLQICSSCFDSKFEGPHWAKLVDRPENSKLWFPSDLWNKILKVGDQWKTIVSKRCCLTKLCPRHVRLRNPRSKTGGYLRNVAKIAWRQLSSSDLLGSVFKMVGSLGFGIPPQAIAWIDSLAFARKTKIPSDHVGYVFWFCLLIFVYTRSPYAAAM